MSPREEPSAQGVLELNPKGFGFLRNPGRSYSAQPGDAYVGPPLINKHNLREGLLLSGPVEPARKGSGPRLRLVDQIEGRPAQEYKPRKFDDLTADRSARSASSWRPGPSR